MPQTKSAEPKEENEMAKKEGWQKGVGPYSNPTGEDPIARRTDPNKWHVKDVSKNVQTNADQDGGFSGKLTSGE